MSTLMGNLKTAIFFDIPLSKNPLIFGGYSLLKLAIKMRNRKEIVKLLIKKGARVNKKYCDKSAPLLHIAIKQQHLDIVKLLVKKGANVNEPHRHKLTAMLVTVVSLKKLSIDSPSINIMKFLIKSRADIQAKDKNGGTALDLSCSLQQFKMARLLLKLNIKVNFATIFDSNVISLLQLFSFGENPTLLHAAIVGHDVKMVEILINHGADIHYKTGMFLRTPLMLAIEKKLERTIYSKPINNFWELSYYKYLVKYISYNLYKCIIAMKEHRIGTSTISFFHLWTAPWNQLINHAYNKDVRELCISDYADKYPLFTCMIQKRFNGAVKRSKLLEKFTEKFFFLLKTLPFLCCQTILTYFDDDDLELFNILTYLYYSHVRNTLTYHACKGEP
ncbi:Similar to RF_0381: Putative ankyrin repeat protein RF_0381 (Rickettsia felis (strain ATCC VR-1525 / URRWXCal2)) [Cotesia congregata]|uniref:Similar to RF_0381: Putative ankyrin repeat protein RF_0381 (Rickettsia felis (Strain ATCC VR-1525 / URRWXCal2)) n=1 Tax=Cotesia congregata TaxID=51543 RepID=A0A8J2EJ52_COTCN|nr:Similar to RF_0381: Putative ankyrin repeat protein RF_0381 (Rickettsia felis (strain ATCC VR-1525 / URRWXCal2)) [Cotesia congregata]